MPSKHIYSVKPLICAEAVVPRPFVYRHAGWGETVKIASVAWLLERGAERALIDTSLGACADVPAYARLHETLAGMWTWRSGGVLDALAAESVAAGEIGTIYLTHLHNDHVAGLPAFPEARVVLSKRGWEAARGEHHPWFATYAPELMDHLASRPVELAGDEEDVGDGVSVRWLGGHSPCSQAVIIDTTAGRTAFAGDVVPMALSWSERHPTGHYQSLREVARAYEILEGFDLIVPGHDPDQPSWNAGLRTSTEKSCEQ